MKKYNEQGYDVIEFDSMYECKQFIENTEDIKNYRLIDAMRREPRFYGEKDFSKVLERLKYGDDLSLKYYLDNIKSKEDDTDSYNSIRMDIEGFAYDMGAVVSGEPECCLNQNAPSTSPYKKIYIDIGYNVSVPAKVIHNRGIAIYELISSLLAKGYILDIYIIHYITCNSGEICAQKTKLNTDLLSIAHLAFAGTCEFFRVVSWLLTAIQIGEKSYCGEGMSKPSDRVLKSFPKDVFYIPAGYTDDRFNTCDIKDAENILIELFNRSGSEN